MIMKIGKISVLGDGQPILQSKGIGKPIRADRTIKGKLPNMNKSNCLGKINTNGNVEWY